MANFETLAQAVDLIQRFQTAGPAVRPIDTIFHPIDPNLFPIDPIVRPTSPNIPIFVPTGLIQHVQPGDLITAQLVNSLIDRINQLSWINTQFQTLQDQVQTLAAKPATPPPGAAEPATPAQPSTASGATMVQKGNDLVLTLAGDGLRTAEMNAVTVAGEQVLPRQVTETAHGMEITIPAPSDPEQLKSMLGKATAGTLEIAVANKTGPAIRQMVALRP